MFNHERQTFKQTSEQPVITIDMPAPSQTDSLDCAPITCILSDVDGVMTDGRIIYDSAGQETKQFHVRDGMGIKQWMKAGFNFGIITARNSPMVDRRAKELGIPWISQGAGNKQERAAEMIQEMKCEFENVCYLGDDLPDLPVMRLSGIAAAPADASTDACEVADWVLQTSGGHGAVREAVERLLRGKNMWNSLCEVKG